MNITSEKPIMIFSKTKDDRTFYSIGLSKKLQDNTYENGYMSCQFKKGVSLDNQTKIKLKSAWVSFYLKDKITIPYVFINEFEVVVEEPKKVDKDQAYIDFGDVVDDSEVAF